MDLHDAEQLALRLIAEHLGSEWKFKFDNARRRFGYCAYAPKTISLSKRLVQLNGIDKVRLVILHEIAHGLAGPQGGRARHHRPAWKAACKRIGTPAVRCYNSRKDLGGVVGVRTPEPKFRVIYTCPNCGQASFGFRIPVRDKACGACCRRHAGSVYDKRFKLRVNAAVPFRVFRGKTEYLLGQVLSPGGEAASAPPRSTPFPAASLTLEDASSLGIRADEEPERSS